MDHDSIMMTEKDYARLSHLFKNLSTSDVENLFIELDRAKIVSDGEIPADVVTMNSTVEYMDLSTNKSNIVTIVYPKDADAKYKKVSILASLGSALIGLRKDQEITWLFPSGDVKRLKVVKVIYQPEANQDWHL